MKPQRIQRKRTKGWRMPPNTVYVGRPSKWGNPYTLTEVAEPKLAVKLYKTLFDIKHNFPHRITTDVYELKGKNLACWCPLDKPCHADILLKIANERR